MAGGIYTTRPFNPNVKCIVFGFAMVAAYAGASAIHLNRKEVEMKLTVPIFIAAYVGMAWYDMAYSCEDKMLSGTAFAPISIMKPMAPNQCELKDKNVYLFHLFIANALIYNIAGKEQMPLALTTMAGITAYHGYKLLTWE